MLSKYIDTVIPYLTRNKVFKSEYVNQIDGIQFMELSNCWVRYLVRGEGKHTIVLAPDSPVTIEAYGEVIDILSEKYRVLIFETPAFGFSIPKIHFDFSYIGWTDTIANFLRKVNLGPYVLAIPCVAGLSAIGIANKYPEMVEGIVSTQTPCWNDERNWVRSWDTKGVMTVPFWSQLIGHYLKTRKVHLIHRIITNKNKRHLEELSKKTLKEGACNCLATACQYYLVKEKPELLKPVRQPTISIWGEADKSHNRSGTLKSSILEYLPNAEIIYLGEAGHFLEVEEPEIFTKIVIDFVTNKIEQAA